MFLDKATISIKAGDGGKGAISFLRNRTTATGGPDGGDGGKGGDIIFRASKDLNTLYNFKFKRKFVAENGKDGSKTNCTGKNGANVIIDIPCGTVIYDTKTNKVIADMRENEQLFTALKGGLGGRGNSYFATSTRRAPRFSQTGEICEEKKVILELKTIADVGLVGFPNVGKSTLLSVISAARPKIADYAFTTLTPNLGVVSHFENTFVVADIPGLIEGASEGVGLGHDFLKHIERVRLILHMVDISETEGRNAFDDYKILNLELKNYSKKLAELPQIIVLTKCDLLKDKILKQKIESFKIEIESALKENKYDNADERDERFFKKVIISSEIEKQDMEEIKNAVLIIPISAITMRNIDNLKRIVWEKLKILPKIDNIEVEKFDFDKRDKTSVEITKNKDGSFVLDGGYIDNLIRGVVLSDFVSFAYFQKRLKQDGIIEKLKAKGIKDGDIIHIKDVAFEFIE